MSCGIRRTRIDEDFRDHIWADLTLYADPLGSVPELEILDMRHLMGWQGTATTGVDYRGRPTWTQTAKSVARFCGSEATAQPGDVQLVAGRVMMKVLVTYPGGHTNAGADTSVTVQ